MSLALIIIAALPALLQERGAPVAAFEQSHPLLREAVSQWQAYDRSLAGRVVGVHISEVTRDASGKIVETHVWKSEKRGDFRVSQVALSFDGRADLWQDRVSGRNSKYHFRLERPSPGRPYVVVEVLFTKDGPASAAQSSEKPKPRNRLSNVAANSALALFPYFLQESLYDVVGDEKTMITGVIIGNDPANICLDLAFRDKHKRDVKVNAVLNTRIHYLPQKIHISFQDVSVQVENEFHKMADDVVVLKSQNYSYQMKRGNFTGRGEYIFKLHTDPWSESDFTLSAFGLPEPYGIEWERPTPWWLYAGVAAGVLLLVISLLLILKRRMLA